MFNYYPFTQLWTTVRNTTLEFVKHTLKRSKFSFYVSKLMHLFVNIMKWLFVHTKMHMFRVYVGVGDVKTYGSHLVSLKGLYNKNCGPKEHKEAVAVIQRWQILIANSCWGLVRPNYTLTTPKTCASSICDHKFRLVLIMAETGGFRLRHWTV